MTQKMGSQPPASPTQKISEKTGALPASGKTTEKLGGPKPATGAAAGNAGQAALDGKTRRGAKPETDRAARRGRTIKFALLGLGLIGIVVGFLFNNQDEKAPTSGNAPARGTSPASGPAKVGEVVEKANLSASVMKVNRNFTHPDPAIKPEPGKKFVVVEFKLTNKDPRAVNVSAARQFKLRDSTQTRYEVSPIGAPDPKFPEGTVAPGQTVTGWIAFQVPQESTGLRLLFDPSVPV